MTEQQAHDTLICELGDLNEVKEVFERYPKDIAAIFIEPLPANNGLLIQEVAYLQGTVSYTHLRAHETVLDLV